MNEFGTGHWTLTLDADELLIFPFSEKIQLPKLCSYLQSQGSDSLQTFMLDMYSNKPVGKAVIQQNQPFLEVCNYFDSDTYMFSTPGADLKPEFLRGGVRSRVFWTGNNRDLPPPYLGKVPLVYWKRGMSFKASTHLIEANKAVDISGILLHFKFLSDFLERVPDEVVRDEHWKGAIQYRYYNDIIKRNPDLNLVYNGSVKYEDTHQLIRMGFMKSSEKYENYCHSTPDSR